MKRESNFCAGRGAIREIPLPGSNKLIRDFPSFIGVGPQCMVCSIELGAHWEEEKMATQAIASAKERHLVKTRGDGDLSKLMQ